MKKQHLRITGAVVTIVATALVVSACSSGTATSPSAASTKSLVVDNTFDLITSDPGRAFELTASIVDKALYQTALTFNGSDLTKIVPQLTTYTISSDQKTVTLTLTGKHTFSTGNPVTVDDIVWSYQRFLALNKNGGFLLQDPAGKNVVITKTSATTLTLTSSVANPALPSILPNPSLGVLDEKTLEKHGGTNDKTDAAESYLDGHSVGSGPYELSSFAVKSKVVFVTNPKYTGTKPAYGRVVLQNVTGPTQKIDIQGNNAQVVTGLNSAQVSRLASSTIKVLKTTSANVGYLFLNQSASASKGVTNNVDFITAVRKGIDYSQLEALGGAGSAQPGGMVPSQFLGSLPVDSTTSFDLAAAKAALAKSGYSGQAITLTYPSNYALDGIAFGDLAQKVQAQLETVGIKVTLAGVPVDTMLAAYRANKLQAGMIYWGPDFPDPSDYLTFSAGGSLAAARVGWTADKAPTVAAAAQAAQAAVTPSDRQIAYQAWGKAMNTVGPFIPFLQAARYFVTASTVSNVLPNAVWTVDLAVIK